MSLLGHDYVYVLANVKEKIKNISPLTLGGELEEIWSGGGLKEIGEKGRTGCRHAEVWEAFSGWNAKVWEPGGGGDIGWKALSSRGHLGEALGRGQLEQRGSSGLYIIEK